MYLVEVSTAIVSFVFGILVLYLTAYSKAKGKNRALEEDVSRLEDEKQKIIAKYRAETEELKKQHSLEIEKRKYKYEDKRAQFTKYFSMLDQFHGKSHKIFTERFPPIMNEFLGSYLEDNEESKNNAIVVFNSGIQTLFHELYEEQIKISNETNSIRLISSTEIDKLLDELELAVKNSTDDAGEMMKFMGTPPFWTDQTLLSPYQRRAEESGALVLQCRDKLRSQMKYELDEI